MNKYFYSKGKRKTAVATIRLYPKGKGEITINGKKENEYFRIKSHLDVIHAPLRITKHLKEFDISAKVKGSGINAQAEAVRHGISRALLQFDPLLRTTLKRMGFLTRDSRMKERKKYGLKRARRAPQWQKR